MTKIVNVRNDSRTDLYFPCGTHVAPRKVVAVDAVHLDHPVVKGWIAGRKIVASESVDVAPAAARTDPVEAPKLPPEAPSAAAATAAATATAQRQAEEDARQKAADEAKARKDAEVAEAEAKKTAAAKKG